MGPTSAQCHQVESNAQTVGSAWNPVESTLPCPFVELLWAGWLELFTPSKSPQCGDWGLWIMPLVWRGLQHKTPSYFQCPSPSYMCLFHLFYLNAGLYIYISQMPSCWSQPLPQPIKTVLNLVLPSVMFHSLFHWQEWMGKISGTFPCHDLQK